MARYAYDRLTFLDNSFLIMEQPNTPMHIAGTATYEAGPLKKPDGGIDIDKIRAYVESRMDRLPRYRQVLSYVPIENHPVWVDDNNFDVNRHLHRIGLIGVARADVVDELAEPPGLVGDLGVCPAHGRGGLDLSPQGRRQHRAADSRQGGASGPGIVMQSSSFRTRALLTGATVLWLAAVVYVL